ncbi:ABC transporter substrate-binding protein [Leucobacter coleopterorum]|uniref:ABC transporter substrate-binding protein n=1 Tax=Leucobacter coleopterorum TaxID=2714933 RepID=A0ABX6JU21_9MICO|nr:ABC transporter substrate-binding protein [Leucobacter coleopterorum]QIM17781.1 ABC transporter substrate-binding protein [Leucobacter coleopterorum]
MKTAFIKTATVVAASSLLLVGCAGDAKPSEPVTPISKPVAGEVPDGVLKGYSVTYAGDGGTTQDAQMSAFFTPFAETSGVKFEQDSPQTLAKIQSQVESGNIQWDFISSFGDAIARECGTLFEKLDLSKLDTSNVPESLMSGTECGVPSIVYGTVLAYDADKFKADAPKNWADFFDVKKFPGTRALYSGDGKIDGSTVQAAALAAGWNPDSDKWSVEWANKGLDKIDSIKDNIVFYGTGAQAQQMLESGEAVMGGVWSGRALAAAKNGAPVEVAWDQWVSLVDYFAIVKGTKNSEEAYYAINYALGADQQAAWVEASGYSPTNVNAKPKVDDLTQSYILTTPERQKTGVDLELAFWSDTDTITPLQDRWAALVAGA